MKTKIVLIAFLLTVLLTGCSNGDNKSKLFDYNNYIKVCRDVYSSFEIEGFSKVDKTDILDLVVVDKDATFGKREYLTLDGKESADTTQFRIEYLDSDKKNTVFIDVIYLFNSINENNLVYFNKPSDELADNEIISMYDDDILTYRNLMFKITYIDLDKNTKSDASLLPETTKKMVKFLEEKYGK